MGKTSVAAAMSLILSGRGFSVVAVDADSVPNLAQSLGIPYDRASRIVPIARDDRLIAERTGVAPGTGWGAIFKLNPRVDDLLDRYGVAVRENLRLVVLGGIDASKQGCMCPAIALARRFLRHTLRRREVVVVDSEAGAEVFGRGLAENFDLAVVVCEPTVKSVLIGVDMVRMAGELGVRESVIVVNKARDREAAARLLDELAAHVRYRHVIGFDEELPKLEYEGRGLTELGPDSVFIRDVEALVDKYVVGLLED